MILGIGVDSVEVHRFAKWHTYPEKNVRRIFSQEEIDYCLQQPNKSAERFAVRFAAKEAFFKALCALYTTHDLYFLTVCRYVSVKKCNQRPVLVVEWNALAIMCGERNFSFVSHLSLTHTQHSATAFVVIENN